MTERRANLLLAFAVLLILGTGALYATLIYGWLFGSKPAAMASVSTPVKADPQHLEAARLAYRDAYLDARAWLSLSEALHKAARPVDAFYVAQGAREFFGDEAFLRAHEAVVLKRAQGLGATDASDEQAVRARLQSDPDNPALITALVDICMRTGRGSEAHRSLDLGLTAHPNNRALLLAKGQLTALTDPAQSIVHYARAVHSDPSSYEAIRALEELGKMAAAKEEGPRAESARQAREGLEELRKAHPSEPGIFTTLCFSLWARGDLTTVRALVVETGRSHPNHAGVSAIEGALALEDKDAATALKRFTAAWERNPDDLYSAQKLAQLYDQQRGDAEGALPYYIALYRREPLRLEGADTVELVIRRTLDGRRQMLLKAVPPESLGRWLGDEDASLRAEACVRAAELKDPRWLERLAEMLDDDTEIVRHNADYALYQLAKQYPDAVQVRRDDWLANNKPFMRARVLNLFADIWPQETWPLVQRALYDQSPALRYLVKTMILDRYYKDLAVASRAKAEYLAQEKNPLVLAQYDLDHKRARSAGQ